MVVVVVVALLLEEMTLWSLVQVYATSLAQQLTRQTTARLLDSRIRDCGPRTHSFPFIRALRGEQKIFFFRAETDHVKNT